jgi:mono/diheme cytochrome c family protein
MSIVPHATVPMHREQPTGGRRVPTENIRHRHWMVPDMRGIIPKMPAWGNKLSTQDMDDIIAWFQAKWSDEIYTEWVKRDSQAN